MSLPCLPCWRLEECKPISITPILSQIFKACALSDILIKHDLLPKIEFGFHEGLHTRDALLTLIQALQVWFDAQMESKVISLDFSSTLNMGNHKVLLFRLKKIGPGGAFSLILELSHDRSQRVVLDGAFSSCREFKPGVPLGSVLAISVLFISSTSDM